MKKLAGRTARLIPTRRLSSHKVIWIEEGAEIEIPRIEISKGLGRCRGGGPRASIVGSRGTFRKNFDISERENGERMVCS